MLIVPNVGSGEEVDDKTLADIVKEDKYKDYIIGIKTIVPDGTSIVNYYDEAKNHIDSFGDKIVNEIDESMAALIILVADLSEKE